MLARTETPRVHVIATRYSDDAISPCHTVLVDGEVYSGLNRWLLAALREGMTPEDLQLEPDDDEDEPWPGSPDEDSTILTSKRGWR